MWKALLLPVLAFFGVFTVWPIAQVLVMSLYQTNFMRTTFVGFDNYVAALTDPDFLRSMLNTAGYMAILVVGQIVLGLFFALELSSLSKRWQDAGRIILYIPVLAAGIIISGVWRWVFHADGPLNWLMSLLGLPSVAWLASGETAIPAIAAVVLLSSVGGNVIVFLSGILSIDKDVLDAARIDGASEWKVKWGVVVPILKPMVLLVGFMSAIASFQIFENILMLAPQNYAATMTFYVYQQGFQFSKYGMASAEAVILLMMVLGLSMAKRRLEK